ncbi:hypothetical protein BTUL_0236g00030 [Botrytis tulipae]|uniref:Uncharacterized protein n=1 Tax=Botrytis tulipae TaxID=87230 RepID=A0A4Z1EBG7_9HELO|nr:hypothetical protein BTUL_0236g00030 [Botrytis tulipae]
MSDSAYLVGAFLPRNNTASGGTALKEDDVVSRVEETTTLLGMKPAAEIRPGPYVKWENE